MHGGLGVIRVTTGRLGSVHGGLGVIGVTTGRLGTVCGGLLVGSDPLCVFHVCWAYWWVYIVCQT